MVKLLKANFARVIKSATFWIFVTLYALYPIIIAVIENSSFEHITSEKMLSLNYGVEWFPLQGLLIAFLCSILFSADFHNGTLKNKIIIGQSKSNIYLANLLTMMILSLAMSVVYLLVFFVLGMPLLGKFTSSASMIIWMLVNGALMLMTYSAVMTLIVMVSKNSTAAVIISLAVLTCGALIAFAAHYYTNNIPPFIKDFMRDEFGNLMRDEFGDILLTDVPNPYYPSKAVRGFCQFLLDFFPSGQSAQISNGGYSHTWQMLLYSLGLITATSGIGIAVFKKSNIK
ncbi:MAG: ABC transporter permease [Clostridia bacterium]|nr:ABC transporter permease [Clostridia bacterium]